MPLRLVLLLGAALVLAVPASAQERGNDEARTSPNAMIGQTIGTTDVMISYGRPSVRGRVVFGELEPYGAVWRTGANEATTITFSDDVMVEGQSLAAGTYGLFTIPSEDEWTVIFNSVAEQWGAYDYSADSDVLRVMVEPRMGDMDELMTFAFDMVEAGKGMLVLHWDEVEVPITISTGS
ncbi:MAG: DUF2911 domain-containing protein [Bacteroidota bacterium]